MGKYNTKRKIIDIPVQIHLKYQGQLIKLAPVPSSEVVVSNSARSGRKQRQQENYVI